MQTVTVPRPVFGVCAEPPCRIGLQAVRGQVEAGTKQPAGMLLEVREFYRRHPAHSWYRFSFRPAPLQPGNLEGKLQVSPERAVRVRLNPQATLQIESLHFPRVPGPGESAVFGPVRVQPAGTFRCGQDADEGVVFSVPWVRESEKNAGKPASGRRHGHDFWPPLYILNTTGRLFVLSHLPDASRPLWMALSDCLGPMAVARPEEGEIAHAQAIGVSLWQWLEPAGKRWKGVNARLRRAPGDIPAVAVVVRGAVRVFDVKDPVDFLETMAREGILAPDAVWAAWTRLLQAGVLAAHFARLRPYLLESPREGEERHADRP